MPLKAHHRKCFIPLESNPEVFTELTHLLGVSSLAFADVFSLDDPDLLMMVPRPVLALILLFPTGEASPNFEHDKAKDEAARPVYSGSGEKEDVIWFKQTIYNACGLYGILHALTNGEARSLIQPNSILSHILRDGVNLPPEGRALVLEGSQELEAAHTSVAVKGDSAVPGSPEDEVDCHYVCFVKSHESGHLYEMDGDRKGPVDLGAVLKGDEDLLCDAGLEIIRKYISREEGRNLSFGLLALVPNQGWVNKDVTPSSHHIPPSSDD